MVRCLVAHCLLSGLSDGWADCPADRRGAVSGGGPVADRLGLGRQDAQGVVAGDGTPAGHPPTAHRRRHLRPVQRLGHRLRQLRQNGQTLGL